MRRLITFALLAALVSPAHAHKTTRFFHVGANSYFDVANKIGLEVTNTQKTDIEVTLSVLDYETKEPIDVKLWRSTAKNDQINLAIGESRRVFVQLAVRGKFYICTTSADTRNCLPGKSIR